jgi:hypothetical protein
MLEYFIAIWYILDGKMVVTWYIFPRFGIFFQEKSVNPGAKFQCRESAKEKWRQTFSDREIVEIVSFFSCRNKGSMMIYQTKIYRTNIC